MFGGGFTNNFGSVDPENVETINSINEEIKVLKDELGDIDVLNKDAIKANQDATKALEKRRDAILGVTKAKRSEMAALQGSISFLKTQVSKLEDVRNKTAKTGEEYDSFTGKINVLKQQIGELDGTYEKWLNSLDEPIDSVALDDIFSKDPEDINFAFVDLDEQELLDESNKILDEMTRAWVLGQENLVDATADAFQRIADIYGIDLTNFRELLKLKQDADETDKAYGIRKTRAYADAIGEIGLGVISAISQAQAARTQQEINNLQTEKDVSLAFAGDSAAAKGAIEERYAKKVRQIKVKEFKKDRADAKTSIAINTAVGIVKTFAELGWPAGIAGAAVLAALGITQVALVNSQPVPQFQDGVENFSGGKAIINDQKGSKYREIVQTPDGRFHKPKGRNLLVDLPTGSNVLSASDSIAFEKNLNGVLGENGINGYGGAVYRNMSSSNVVVNSNAISRIEMEAIMQKTLGNLNVNHVSYDKRGVSSYTIKQHSKRISLNNQVEFKSKRI